MISLSRDCPPVMVQWRRGVLAELQANSTRAYGHPPILLGARARFHGDEIQRCRSKEQVKALLNARHHSYFNGCP